MDADGSHRPEDFPALLKALVEQNADLVLGSRYVRGGKTVGWPKHREILSKGGNTWVRLVTGMKLADATGGYRLFRRETLERIELWPRSPAPATPSRSTWPGGRCAPD